MFIVTEFILLHLLHSTYTLTIKSTPHQATRQDYVRQQVAKFRHFENCQLYI